MTVFYSVSERRTDGNEVRSITYTWVTTPVISGAVE